MTMNTTLVINAKGGVGKTHDHHESRELLRGPRHHDDDRRLRPPRLQPELASSSAATTRARSTVPIFRRASASGFANGRRVIPRDTRQLIIDAPAGPWRLLLQDLLARTQSILIPVAPSSIDVHATANFIKELLLVGHVRFRNIRVAVIANRVRNNKPVYAPLEKFVASLGITFLGRVSDSDVYVDAAETGLGVFELPAEAAAAEQREFLPIVRWVQGEQASEDAPSSNVVPISAARA